MNVKISPFGEYSAEPVFELIVCAVIAFKFNVVLFRQLIAWIFKPSPDLNTITLPDAA